MTRPNYFVIGAAKAASSSITTLLGLHPEIFMVDCKETCFFSHDEIFRKGLGWYESLYSGCGTKSRKGEGSNTYSMKEVWPNVVSRIADYSPDAKLIYVVRDPLPRIESLWLQMRANGDRNTHPDFNRAIRERPEFFVDSTNYFRQIAPFRDHFPQEQIKIVFFEDFIRDSSGVMNELFEYLGVDRSVQLDVENCHFNQTTGKKVYTNGLIYLRRATWLKPLKRLLSDRLKQVLADKFFRTSRIKPPIWKSVTCKFVMDRLASDCIELLRQNNKPEFFWSSCHSLEYSTKKTSNNDLTYESKKDAGLRFKSTVNAQV